RCRRCLESRRIARAGTGCARGCDRARNHDQRRRRRPRQSVRVHGDGDQLSACLRPRERVDVGLQLPSRILSPTSSPMHEPPLSAEREARRRSILQAAIETFAQQGFSAARTRDIAAHAGVAEGTIYLYFDSKDELLLTAFRETVREFSASVERLLDDPRPLVER